MEFKVFKNENDKILKEYWLTQSEWDALDKTTVQEGDIYHIVGTIDKGDLSADVNASLAKADSSLQKPTATLAKESFVKVGIDGTQNFDENSYVVAPSTDGTAGQVLKKTASGTEWADGKYYIHDVSIVNNDVVELLPVLKFKYISKDNTQFTLDKFNFNIFFDVYTTDNSNHKYYNVKSMTVDSSGISIEYYSEYPLSDSATGSAAIPRIGAWITDVRTEL